MLWRIHHWAGLYTGILIGVLSLTGALAVFIPEIDSFIKKVHYRASSSPSASGRPEFSRSLSALTRQYGDFRSVSVELPAQAGEVAEIKLLMPVGSGLETFAFFIDTGRDRILASRIHQNSLANYMRQMHVRLYEGNWGRQLVGLGGIALALLVITGLLIYGNFMKRQAWPDIRKGRGLRIVMADWHKILGIGALAFNLVIALTGAWLGLQPWLMKWLDIRQPNGYRPEVIMDKEQDKKLSIDWKAALEAAEKEFPELIPRQIVPSVNGSATIAFRGNLRGTVYEREINTLVLSKQTLTPLFKYDIRQQSFGDKFYFIQEALHFGDFGGLALKVLYALLGLVSAFLSVSGFLVFLCRTKTRERKTAPLKLVVAYSLGIVLLLIIAALISLFIGYAQAALSAAIFINGLLTALLVYALAKFLVRRLANTRKPANI
ncbi:MAG TPA: PepSY-associated TM helix domain-containing protein [Anseongella sp.]|nr:PepSY-associated TM helix domain-containing protein [Anseongella sp.]